MPSYIIEFKDTKTETDLKQLASKVVEQSKELNYEDNIFIGLAHYGKNVEMNWNGKL